MSDRKSKLPLRVLIIWELGAGLGHLVPIRALAAALVAQRASVVVATKDASRARPMLQSTGATVLAAPRPTPASGERRFNRLRSYAHILHNVGCATADGLSDILHRWHVIFDAVAPDVVVFEHSPLALLASRGRAFRKVVFGAGFTVPPPTSPLGVFGLGGDSESDPRLRQDENELVDRINLALKRNACTPLQHLMDLYYQDVDRRYCAAFGELDHFGRRNDLVYVGPPPVIPGIAPNWLHTSGPRVFAYLSPFESMPHLMDALREQRASVIVYGRGIPAEFAERYRIADGFRFEQEAVDIRRAAQECDLGILNATNATTADLLLAGKPLLQVPMTTEQAMLAKRTEELGLSLTLRSRATDAGDVLQSLVTSTEIRPAAEQFAGSYRYHDDAYRRAQMNAMACELRSLSLSRQQVG